VIAEDVAARRAFLSAALICCAVLAIAHVAMLSRVALVPVGLFLFGNGRIRDLLDVPLGEATFDITEKHYIMTQSRLAVRA
jgi:hypothetical protein